MLPTGIIDLRAAFPYLRLGSFAFTLGLVAFLLLVAAVRRRVR
jgi:hypothetical protein